MRHLVVLFIHFLATLVRLLGPGDVRSIVAESLLVAGKLLFRPRFPALLAFCMRHPAQLLNVNHLRQRCMKARPDTPISPYYSNRQIAFLLFARSGAPGETWTPGLLARSQWSKYAKCPIWRRLRTGNAILPSISCTQCCTQNRVISCSEVNERPIPTSGWPSSARIRV